MGDDACQQCGHAFDPHVVVATTGEAVDGGIVLCPVVDCECFATWGVDDSPARFVPDRAEIAALRERVQHPERQ